MIEFVEAVPLARILAEHRTITAFLNEHNPDGPGAAPEQGLPSQHVCLHCWPAQSFDPYTPSRQCSTRSAFPFMASRLGRADAARCCMPPGED